MGGGQTHRLDERHGRAPGLSAAREGPPQGTLNTRKSGGKKDAGRDGDFLGNRNTARPRPDDITVHQCNGERDGDQRSAVGLEIEQPHSPNLQHEKQSSEVQAKETAQPYRARSL